MATSADQAAYLALVKAQAVTRTNLHAQVVALAAASAASFRDWYDHAAITRWSTDLARNTEAILRVLANSTDAYAARSAATVGGKSFRPVGRIDVASTRIDLSHGGAYARAADVYRYQQSRFDQFARELATATDANLMSPPDLVTPQEAAKSRVAKVADQDVQLVVRDQTRATFQAAEDAGLITGWRRIIHPELSRGGTCGLCIAASDRIYRTSELMPIHGECNCVPGAVRDGNDPGSAINEADLERLYAEAGSTGAKDLKRTRYRVDQHGNLGPQLVDAKSPKRTAADAKRSEIDRPKKTAAKTREVVDRLHKQDVALLPRAKSLAADNPKKWGPYLKSLETRIADLERQLS